VDSSHPFESNSAKQHYQEKLISIVSALKITCFKKPEIRTKQKENENMILHRIIMKQIENLPKNGMAKFGSHS